MKKTLLIIAVISMISTSLFVSTQQLTSAQTYSNSYGSDDKYLTKVKVEKIKGNIWAYIVKACATDRHMAIASVILKSDIDERLLGVNKNLGKGHCTYYGAVMNAKDGKTLGADLIEKHEALEKLKNSPINSKKTTLQQQELAYYRYLFP